MDKEIIGSRMEQRRKELGYTLEHIADTVGVAASTIQRYEKGAFSKIKLPVIEAIAAALQVSPAWLCGESEQLDTAPQLSAYANSMHQMNVIDVNYYQKVPILGQIAAGLPLLAQENVEGYTLSELTPGHTYFALRVHGDSMNAAGLNDGYLLIIRQQEEVENGEIAVVMVGDEEATVKRFYCTGTTVTLAPQSTNPVHMPQIYDLTKTQIRILGKVVKVEFTL